ncbi:MAG: 3-hydroxyacyl-ACP dehydratase FabZ [Bacteroidales bacterium]|jgi:3-hydroxyacyl-[acyl-carrier-protein] dehydratase|nr:3-hydroxyacyl-ACP dehydratase FabZ [Bacteroidales bacterium]MDD2205085.1 3-hydroxyacyl-ACP dehydratase FabZ [Bacteroidales bacterium]MDD3914567.1 3-hydroxyacyl-ACP dehydratase FabZ [Bacteroidales bacterium]MDD4634488.1 3-hydroxyacyl-ACP dehydratase FabZ [Bacteroidales bacterium]
MNREEIKKYIPHREPMLLVDNIDIDENKIAHATYKVTGEEFFLKGHFPGNPVVPGVILCEIMAQSCCLLIGDELFGRTPLYAGIDKVKFKRKVVPGDLIEVTAQIVNRRALVFFVEAEARVENDLCVKGSLSFILIDNDKLDL